MSNWLSDESNGKWCMVVDNADDMSIFFGPELARPSSGDSRAAYHNPQSLSQFLPISSNGSILITSRSREVASRLTACEDEIVTVEPMDESHALALFRRKLGDGHDEQHIPELLQALDYMPLAISQAAAYIRQKAPRISISRYISNLHRGDKDRAALLKKDLGDSQRDQSASNSIIATWQISFEYIQKHRPSAARLLSLMSFFDRQGIPEFLLHNRPEEEDGEEVDMEEEDMKEEQKEEKEVDENDDDNVIDHEFEDDISTLPSYSLIRLSLEQGMLEMHRLVQFSTRKWLELKNEEEKWKEIYVSKLYKAFPTGQYKNWGKCRILFPHAEQALEYRPKSKSYLIQWTGIMYLSSWFAWGQGKYFMAEKMGQQSFDWREMVLGEEANHTLAASCHLCQVLRSQGKYEAAEKMARRALNGNVKLLGENHPDTLDSMTCLGLVLSDQGKYEAAAELIGRALDGTVKLLGYENLDTLATMNDLAVVLADQGKFEASEQLNRQALEGYEKILGILHPFTLTSMQNLAWMLEEQGKYEVAEEIGRRALGGRAKVLGESHPHTLRSMNLLASVLQSRGKLEPAEHMCRLALGRRVESMGHNHPSTLESMSTLAVVLRGQGRYDEAEAMNQQALDKRKEILGLEHPDTLTTLHDMASIMRCQNRCEAAEDLFRQAFEARKKVLGEQHPKTLESGRELASTSRAQEKHEEAQVIELQPIDKADWSAGKLADSSISIGPTQ